MLELREFLADRTDQESVQALVEGDKLKIGPRIEDWFGRNCYVLHFPRLMLETINMIVVSGPTISEEDDMDEWIDGAMDMAGNMLRAEDEQKLKEGTPIEEPFEPRFTFMMQTLNFTPANVLQAVVTANNLVDRERHVFYQCLVIGQGFGRYERKFGIKAELARTWFLTAIDRLTLAVDE